MQDDQPRWFDFLVANKDNSRKALLEVVARPTHVVARETTSGGRSYAFFSSYGSLYRHILNSHEVERVMHEVCLAGVSQKPRFDIDIVGAELKPDDFEKIISCSPSYADLPELARFGEIVKDLVFEGVQKVLSRSNIELDPSLHFVVCNSSGPAKASYHLLIHGWCHSDHLEAEAFYLEVMAACRVDVRRWVDGGIYKRNHCLRLLLNHKMHDRRVKVFQESFCYWGQTIQHRLDEEDLTPARRALRYFSQSLVCFTDDCDTLPPYELAPSFIPGHLQAIDPIMLGQIQGMLDRAFPEGPFQIGEVKKGFINLERLAPTYCTHCGRTHDKVDPYLLVRGDQVLFNCRRPDSKGKHLQLGELQGVFGDALAAVERFQAAGGRTDYSLVDPNDWNPAAPPMVDLGWGYQPVRLEEKKYKNSKITPVLVPATSTAAPKVEPVSRMTTSPTRAAGPAASSYPSRGRTGSPILPTLPQGSAAVPITSALELRLTNKTNPLQEIASIGSEYESSKAKVPCSRTFSSRPQVPPGVSFGTASSSSAAACSSSSSSGKGVKKGPKLRI